MRMVIGAAFVLVALPGVSWAQGNPCTSDAFKFCSSMIPDQGRIAQCLGSHRSELTPACRAEMGGGAQQTTTRSRRRSRDRE